MFVLAGTIEDNTTLNIDALLAGVPLPQWIKDKIIPITTDGAGVDIRECPFFTKSWVNPVMHSIRLAKQGDQVVMYNNETFTNSSDRSFRIQFDLLIDNE